MGGGERGVLCTFLGGGVPLELWNTYSIPDLLDQTTFSCILDLT